MLSFGDQFLSDKANAVRDVLRVTIDVRGIHAIDVEAPRCEIGIPDSVFGSVRALAMYGAVDFDDQSCGKTVEVEDIRSVSLLAFEDEAVATILEHLPKI